MGAINHEKPLKTNKNHETTLETFKPPSKKAKTDTLDALDDEMKHTPNIL